MNVTTKILASLAMVVVFGTSHAACRGTDGTIEGDVFVAPSELLPACEQAGSQASKLEGSLFAKEKEVGRPGLAQPQRDEDMPQPPLMPSE